MRRRLGFIGAIALAVLLTAACSSGTGKKPQSARTTQPAAQPTSQKPASPASPQAIGALSRSAVEACLTGAGLELATGDTPLVASVKGIGINPGKGSLMPGNVTAAVFPYPSEEEATSAAQMMEGFGSMEVMHAGNVMVVYAESPSAEVRSAIKACTSPE